jgi:hypothetical protein
MTEVIISDYLAERRMVVNLDANDFKRHKECWTERDALLILFKDHPFFHGSERWCDLSMGQFHVLIINMLKICADHQETEVRDPNNPAVRRLTFLLCSLIYLLQGDSHSTIDLLRVSRVGREEVFYDYSARLDVTINRPQKTGLRIVINND